MNIPEFQAAINQYMATRKYLGEIRDRLFPLGRIVYRYTAPYQFAVVVDQRPYEPETLLLQGENGEEFYSGVVFWEEADPFSCPKWANDLSAMITKPKRQSASVESDRSFAHRWGRQYP